MRDNTLGINSHLPWLVYMCTVVHSYVWRDWFTRGIAVGDPDFGHSYVWHDIFWCMTWLGGRIRWVHGSGSRDTSEFVTLICVTLPNSYVVFVYIWVCDSDMRDTSNVHVQFTRTSEFVTLICVTLLVHVQFMCTSGSWLWFAWHFQVRVQFTCTSEFVTLICVTFLGHVQFMCISESWLWFAWHFQVRVKFTCTSEFVTLICVALSSSYEVYVYIWVRDSDLCDTSDSYAVYVYI